MAGFAKFDEANWAPLVADGAQVNADEAFPTSTAGVACVGAKYAYFTTVFGGTVSTCDMLVTVCNEDDVWQVLTGWEAVGVDKPQSIGPVPLLGLFKRVHLWIRDLAGSTPTVDRKVSLGS